jgi:alkyl hydroperoxide reductase subunit AhpC
MQQLQAVSKEMTTLEALKTDVVAISTDDEETDRLLKANNEGIAFPMPLLADPELASFKTYRAYDDFEDVPMHGTFLMDANGGVRFQRISRSRSWRSSS